jgi:hypothetical protein
MKRFHFPDIKKRLMEGLGDIREGRVNGPFRSVPALLRSLHRTKKTTKCHLSRHTQGGAVVFLTENAQSIWPTVPVGVVPNPSLCSAKNRAPGVRSRVAAGGHGIPEAKIGERYESSPLDLVDLMPKLTELRVFDNSEEAEPSKRHCSAANASAAHRAREGRGHVRPNQDSAMGQTDPSHGVEMLTRRLAYPFRYVCSNVR